MKLFLVLIFVFVAATDGVDVQSLPVCEPGFDYGKVNSGSCNSDQGVVFDPTECKALAHRLAKKASYAREWSRPDYPPGCVVAKRNGRGPGTIYINIVKTAVKCTKEISCLCRCSPCTINTFAIGNGEKCQSCPSERPSTLGVTGASSADQCKSITCQNPGEEIDPVSGECVPCPKNTFSPAGGVNTKCTACPRREPSTHGVTGATSVGQCHEKTWCPKGKGYRQKREKQMCDTKLESKAKNLLGRLNMLSKKLGKGICKGCTRCLINTYSVGGDKAKCVDCPSHEPTTMGLTGSDKCSSVTCDPGTGLDIITGQCNTCPINLYSEGGLNIKCKDCPASKPTTMGKIGASSCSSVTCEAGDGLDVLTGTCNKCPENSYSRGGLNQRCVQCPSHIPSTHGLVGVTTRDDCHELTWCDVGRGYKPSGCEDCPINTYSKGGRSVQCEPCSPYTPTTMGKTAQSECVSVTCNEGTGLDLITGKCLSCPLNTYGVGGRNKKCENCPDNTPTTGGIGKAVKVDQCKKCATGHGFENDECYECDVDRYSDGKAECTKCPKHIPTTVGVKGAITVDQCHELDWCPKGKEYGAIRSTGHCDTYILSKKECHAKAKELGIQYVVKNNVAKGVDMPLGCVLTDEGELLLNTNTEAHAECGTGYKKCICRGCTACLANTFSNGGSNVRCQECPPHLPTTNGIIGAEENQCGKKTADLNADKIARLAKLTEQIISHAKDRNLDRAWASEYVRQEYDKMKRESFGKKGSCAHERHTKKIIAFPALHLRKENDELACLSTNRDEFITAFCNFRNDFHPLLKQRNLGKAAQEFWPNICCPEDQGNRCGRNGAVKRKLTVPFALAQGGEYNRRNVYVELLSSLKKNGYLHEGMVNVLKMLGPHIPTDKLKKKIDKVFERSHLCGPRVMKLPTSSSQTICQLFFPYAQLLNAFLTEFDALFVARDWKDLRSRLGVQDAPTVLLEQSEANETSHLSHRSCHLTMSTKDEVKQIKRSFCLKNNVELSDERMLNIVLIYAEGNTEDPEYDKMETELSKFARFDVADKCKTAKLFNANAVSLQKIKEDTEGSYDWAYVVQLDSSSKNSFLRTQISQCNSMKYLPHTTTTLAMYADVDNCCEETKDYGTCVSKHGCFPQPVVHPWTKEEMSFKLSVAGSHFMWRPSLFVLPGTSYTSPTRVNVLILGKDVNGGNIANSEAMSLLEISNSANLPTEFEKFRSSASGKCLNFGGASTILKGITSTDGKKFSFSCKTSPALCQCLVAIAEATTTITLVSGENSLSLIGKADEVSYEIKRDGIQRRRRMLQVGASTGDS